MSDEKPKAGSAPPAPPRLERVAPGDRPAARTGPGAGALPPAAPAAPSGAPASPPAAPPRPGASYGLAAREVGADAAIAAGLAHEGSLARESPLRLFALAAATQATGRLSLTAEGSAFALSFRRGTVEHAASSDPADDLGAFLVRKGALTDAQRARARAASAGAGGDLAAALVAERLVNPADVAALLQAHGAALVHRALQLEAGAWSWAPGAAPPPSGFPLGAPFAMLGAAVRALDAAGVSRRLGDREHRAASRVVGRLRLEDLRLTAQETRAAQLFDGARSAAEIVSATPGDALLVLRLTLLLAECDLLAFGAPRKVASPARPSAATPPGAAPAGASPTAPAAAPRPPAPPGGPPAAPPPQAGAAPGARAAPAAPRPATTPPPRPATTPVPRPALTPLPIPPPPAVDRPSLEALVKKLEGADHFAVLGLKRDAPPAHVKVAYFQHAKTYHPDAVPADAPAEVRKLCADVFARVSEAWSVLGNEASRAAYLEELRSGGKASVDVMAIFQAENTFHEGTLLVKGRRYEEALRKFEAAVRLNPEEAEFAIWKAWCEFVLAPDKRKALAACGAALEAALERNPRCSQGYLFLGQMAKLAGDLALAEAQLKRGLHVAPDHPDLQRELRYLRK